MPEVPENEYKYVILNYTKSLIPLHDRERARYVDLRFT